jgi:formiminotetrahydrofolate cyclodeaminase
MSFSAKTLREFVDALAAAQPTPGGGTASAVAGAMGVALLMMVAGLPKTKANTDQERATLAAVRTKLVPIREALERSADRDAEAFDAVMAAYRLPKGSDHEQTQRKAAIQQALRQATEAPLETLRLAGVALALGETVALHGNPSAASDAGVAAGLLQAAAEGGAANVRANLGGLSDEVFRERAAADAHQWAERAGQAAARMRAGFTSGI